MSVEVKSTSRLKAMLIAVGVLLVGLAVIFGIKYAISRTSAQTEDSVQMSLPPAQE